MPIQFPDFGRISFDEANPLLMGMARGQNLAQNFMQFPQDLQHKILANKIAEAQAQYAMPMQQQKLIGLQQANQYNPRLWESEIGLRGAQTGKLGKETSWYDREAQARLNSANAEQAFQKAQTNKINYLLQHPGFMGGDETKSLEALRSMGLVNNNYQQPNQKSEISSGGFTSYPGNQQSQQYAHPQDIAKAVINQRQNMGISESQTMPSNSGFNVNNLVTALINKPMTDLQYKQTLNKVMQQNLAGKAYNSMPSVEKEYAISQARAFGYTGEQASKLFNQGYDLASMAQSKGYDGGNPSSWPVARGAPTTAIQTRIQRANSTLAGLDAVEPEIAAAYAPYAQRFNGVSPSLIKDMMTGENQDKQAEAFAAYALYPEINALRINAQGGNVGHGAIQHMAGAAFSKFNTLGLSPNSYVYQKAMKRMNELIKKMNRAENSAVYKQTQNSYEDDDKKINSGKGKYDFTNTSMEELMKIAGG